MGLNRAISERIEAMNITDPLTRGIHIKMSGCPNGCSQHHIGNIGFYGASIKVGEHTIPAYVAHIGGNYEGGEIVYGTRLKVRLPAKRVPEAVERWIRKYEAEREDGEAVQRLRVARRHQGVRGRRPRSRHAGRVRPGHDERVHRLDQEGPVPGHPRRGRVRGLMHHLDQLEAEAIHVIREVAAELEKPVLLFSGGKDSIVLLHLARKAFRPGTLPFPVMHVDTGHNFPEVIEFRDRQVPDILVASVQESIDKRPRARRARRATSSRPRRCWTRSRSTASTRRSAAPAATRSARAPRSACSRSATTSGSGTRAASGRSCGTSTTAACGRASTSASSR